MIPNCSKNLDFKKHKLEMYVQKFLLSKIIKSSLFFRQASTMPSSLSEQRLLVRCCALLKIIVGDIVPLVS